ncbi:MAG: PTS sugar transporter subunit IIA [Longimicrobiales bacterium]|nr:PTS sugar transporter subunit IIA [Longimicrobiales bacterium]
MRLRDYLRPDLVLSPLRARDTASALEAIADRLAEAGAVDSRQETLAALAAREETHTTVLGHGMALPHATLPGLHQPLILLALAPEPVPFGPAGTEPVRIFFTLLSPPGFEGEHIKILARICRLVRHPGFVDDLMGSPDPDRALALVRSVDEQHV